MSKEGSVFRVPLTLKGDNFWAQVELVHHRRHLQHINETVGEIPLANCHEMMWMGDITIGGQTFRVHMDCGSSDVWVPSVDCDDSCPAEWTGFDPSLSDTYQPVSRANGQDAGFYMEYADGEFASGTHGVDKMQIGDLTIDQQIFGLVTSANVNEVCGEEGILGLGIPAKSSHSYKSFVGNLLDILKNPIYSLYLDRTNDFTYQDEYNGDLSQVQETSASSEMIFGGVDHKYYTGCIDWHDLADQTSSFGRYEGYWDFHLDSVSTDGEDLGGTNVGILDSGSSFLMGPSEGVGRYAERNDLVCLQFEEYSDGTMSDEPNFVLCNNPTGWDLAALQTCDAPLSPLVFTIDGTNFTLEKESLVLQYETSLGPACFLRVASLDSVPAWIIGDPWFNQYYVAFRIEPTHRQLGFAKLSESVNTETCEADWSLDVTNTAASPNDGSSTPAPSAGSAPSDHVPTLAPSMASRDTEEPTSPAPTLRVAPATLPPRPPPGGNNPVPRNQASDDSSPSSRPTLPIVIGLLVVGFFAVVLVRRRRRRSRYETFDNLGDHLELQEMPTFA